MLQQLLRPVARSLRTSGTRSYHLPENYKPPHMNDLPVPQGSWQEHYNAKQARYNVQLIGGVVVFAGTVTYMLTSGLVFFNFWVPTPKK
ncbi:hypothetical protein KM043_008956 [Ampulex compressa]|nr:hypothetical protein KM043_008956 [Ampulex compressa]